MGKIEFVRWKIPFKRGMTVWHIAYDGITACQLAILNNERTTVTHTIPNKNRCNQFNCSRLFDKLGEVGRSN